MKYEKPAVSDFGSIGDHTYSTAGDAMRGLGLGVYAGGSDRAGSSDGSGSDN